MSKTKKITSLTDAQKARMAEYRDKWLAHGLSTDKANRPEAEAAIVEIYSAAGLTPPRIVWCSSPMSMGLTRAIILKFFEAGASVGASVRASVWASVRASVWASVRDSVRASVGDSVWDSVGASVGASVRASVRDSGYGQHDASWLAFYEYFRDVCGLIPETDKLTGLIKLGKNAGWFLPHAQICWVSERHGSVFLNADGKLHNPSGPAVEYPDKWQIWALNGVRVPKNLVMTEPEQLDPALILTEKNAEVRREIVRKIGAERIIQKLGGKVVDKQGDYELITLHIPDMSVVPTYLKMQNPSIGVWHVEGVPPEIKTVDAALAWRDGEKEYVRPSVLT